MALSKKLTLCTFSGSGFRRRWQFSGAQFLRQRQPVFPCTSHVLSAFSDLALSDIPASRYHLCSKNFCKPPFQTFRSSCSGAHWICTAALKREFTHRIPGTTPSLMFIYSLDTLFVVPEQMLKLHSGLEFEFLRKQSSNSAMDVEKLQHQSSEGESDYQSGRSQQESWGSDISADEEDLIIRLHKLLGDRWALIAGWLPWRTTEEIEKYWKMRSQDIDQSSDQERSE